MENIPIIGDLVKAPTVAAPPPPVMAPPVPTIDNARARRDAMDATARRKGRQASVLTGPEGVADTPTASKTLIGS